VSFGRVPGARPLRRRDEVVLSLLSAIDARDAATGEHSRAVGMWCGRIARILGMSAELQEKAALSGALHDVGKIAIPAEVLLKAGPLDAAEWDVMRAHAAIGGQMLARIPALEDLAPIVRGHHERIDGAGYPDGLCGEAIPPLSRVVSVADAFDAMIRKRPHRNALSVRAALEELRGGIGTRFDPGVAAAMIAIAQPVSIARTLRAAESGGSAG
jgi:HD-GYP domain-containing protein (c-di-GMP phosphodiesterase class II)